MKTKAAPVHPHPERPIYVPFQVKAASVDLKTRTFSGLASTWSRDLGDDIIHPGAFTATLGEWQASQATEEKRAIPLVDSHDYWTVLNAVGKVEAARETDKGLDCTFSVLEGTEEDRYLNRVRSGVVRTLSIGYKAVRFDFVESEESAWGYVRNIYELKLREISLVLFPMNEESLIDLGSVKHLLEAVKRSGHELSAADRMALSSCRDEVTALLEAKSAPAAEAPDGGDTDEDSARREEVLRTLTLKGLERPAARR